MKKRFIEVSINDKESVLIDIDSILFAYQKNKNETLIELIINGQLRQVVSSETVQQIYIKINVEQQTF